MKILIVDDTIQNLTELKSALRKDGFDVLTAENGISAMKIIGETKIDFIVSDLNMPLLDGYELAVCISNGSEKIPFILYTSMDISDDFFVLCKRIGIDKFLPNSTISKIQREVMDRFRNAININEKLINRLI